MKSFLIFLFITFFAIAYGQEGDWLEMPAAKDSVELFIPETLDFTSGNGKVIIKGGEKLQKLEEFARNGEESVEGVKMDGFRVLIFFDQNKTESESQKARFLSMYPEHRAYVDYLAPNYRVRVGNFRTKLEADALKSELIGVFPTAIVIADKIQLPQLPLIADPLDTTNGGR